VEEIHQEVPGLGGRCPLGRAPRPHCLHHNHSSQYLQTSTVYVYWLSPDRERTTDMTQPEGIEVERLVREFKKGPRAVDGIDLEVAPGDIYGFLGPNGAGKSTTVHMLTTLLPPTSGTARVAGFDVVHEGPQVRKVIGAALQEAALDPFLTGREHLRLQTAMHGIAGEERRRRSNELLERVGLTDRVGIIDHGRIVAEGTPEQLKSDIACSTVEAVPSSPEQRGVVAAVLERFGEQTTGFGPNSVAVQLASPNGNLAEIVRALDAEGVILSQLQIHDPTLDDVFLAKTGRHL